MPVTVAVCTWNRARLLDQTLGEMRKLLIPPGVEWELLVVNNNCTDDTDAVIARHGKYLPIRRLFEPKPGLSNARNCAVAAAKGEIIIFTDDDVKPCQDWVATYWNGYKERPRGYFFGGPVESEFDGPLPNLDLIELAPPSVKGLDLGTVAGPVNGGTLFLAANWACPRTALVDVGGFDERFGLDPSSGRVKVGEETDLMVRLKGAGWRDWYLPGAKVRHYVPREKCSLAHLGERSEAFGWYCAQKDLESGGNSAKALFGIPLWCVRRTAVAGLKCAWQSLRRRAAYADYLEFRRLVGSLRCYGARRLDTRRYPRGQVGGKPE